MGKNNTSATTSSVAKAKAKAKKKKPNKSAYKPTGPSVLKGSIEAKRLTAVILEVMAGLRGPMDGAQAVGISLPRYYVLETRALQGLINALEPQPRGRQSTPANRIAELEKENARLERELVRMQSLVRAAQRSIGLKSAWPNSKSSSAKSKSSKKKNADGKARKRRRPQVRAKKTIAVLRKQVDESESDGGSTSETVTAAPPASASPPPEAPR